MVKKTKKEYKPSAKIKASIKSILEFNTKAMKAENLATERNTDFIVKFYDVLKSVKGAERKYILNTVLDSLDKSKAKWIKALINKLLKDDGELNQWFKRENVTPTPKKVRNLTYHPFPKSRP